MGAIVLYPSPGIGHLISMVELGKVILTHNPSFSIHILLPNPPQLDTSCTAPYLASISFTIPSITFHHLPPPPPDPSTTFSSPEALLFHFLRLNNPHVHRTLQSISLSSTVLTFILDGFCTPALEIATSLNIPCYYFFTSGINCLALLLYLPTIHENTITINNIKELKVPLSIPGLPSIPTSSMPEPMVDKTSEVYEWFLDMATQMPKSAGIIINSFESLDPRPFKAVSEGLCITNGSTPPIFCIGPLISSQTKTDPNAECLEWLSLQPSRSVVFLCFGSRGLFSKEQLHEIAIGLEKSEQRFLWVVRSPHTQEQTKQQFLPQPDPDLDLLLPDGFLDRTRGRGFVAKSWAPQVAVLNHGSIGGFVTHCGWNSVLESVSAGVPMIAWPLYAEQKLNKIMMVEEMKVALPMNEEEGGLVSAFEVEERVRELMDSGEGNSVRERVKAMQEEAKLATSRGGSSWVAMGRVLESWKRVG